ncbi:Hypothetical protein POVR1_LOCUS555 [uncultured virus]|nr:Hypothetical protein POVR1_LOCUS555 [uncultured virus]
MDKTCQATTLKGQPCTRLAKNGNFCGLHSKDKVAKAVKTCVKCSKKVKYGSLCGSHYKEAHQDDALEETITITFCEIAENHIGNQQIGSSVNEGFTVKDLVIIQSTFMTHGYHCEMIDLTKHLTDHTVSEASVLIVRNFAVSDRLLEEQKSLTFDTKCKMYGRVVNKKKRHNLCYGEEAQAADYEAGKGTVVAFRDLPELSKVKNRLAELIGEKARNLVAEGNYYYDLRTTSIPYHSDLERKRVIGLRLGAVMSLYFQWFLDSKPIGDRVTIDLNHLDMYIMSEKAVGFDGRKKKIPILRHAAGREYAMNFD